MDLSQLEDIFDYKNKLMEELITNQTIVELIAPNRNYMDNPEGLIYKTVFPFEYVPDTLEDAATYVCYDVDIQKVFDKTYLQPTLYVWVLTHKSLMRLDEGGVRVDKIVSEITKMLNGSRCYTMGELELYGVRRFSIMNDYCGKQITFVGKEWNRPKSARDKHEIPDNRKRV